MSRRWQLIEPTFLLLEAEASVPDSRDSGKEGVLMTGTFTGLDP